MKCKKKKVKVVKENMRDLLNNLIAEGGLSSKTQDAESVKEKIQQFGWIRNVKTSTEENNSIRNGVFRR